MPETTAIGSRLREGRTPSAVPIVPPKLTAPSVPVPVTPSYPLPAPGSLVGRQRELGLILAALPDELSQPVKSRLVLLAAEAGMGKTRLLAEVARHAVEHETLVLAGGCYEEEGRLSWGPIHDALLDYVRAQPDDMLYAQLGDLLPQLVQIVPELQPRLPHVPELPSTDAETQRLRLFSTVAQILERISSDRRLLLLLDDLHWADEVTLQVLHFLLRQPGLERVLLLGAYRSDEMAPGTQLARLVDKAGETLSIPTVSVQALSADDTSKVLAERVGGKCDMGLISTLHERSAGNPFFAMQMFRLLEREGRVRLDGGSWRLAPGAQVDLPPAVRDTIARRLRLVEPAVRTTLGLGAVLGREFPFAALEAMADASEDVLFGELDAAREAHLIRESGDGYAFVHPLLWEVAYGRVPDQRRRRLHEGATLALERLYGDSSEEHVAELAWHAVEAGSSERSVRYRIRRPPSPD
ncbi:MAG: ATP-binding protein [Chloroflexota bacterium]|nr:MAG: hypothetical protein DLM70_15045 [Chloroflexota bacterium]